MGALHQPSLKLRLASQEALVKAALQSFSEGGQDSPLLFLLLLLLLLLLRLASQPDGGLREGCPPKLRLAGV